MYDDDIFDRILFDTIYKLEHTGRRWEATDLWMQAQSVPGMNGLVQLARSYGVSPRIGLSDLPLTTEATKPPHSFF